ncbi:uncharacterized protein LOC135942444 [Cloeon dipterum]|uniref:uncharacterized protein LOC135942444 n=1 Tax=Cloeon dipterum TaxID=197152 RepID=UPI00321FE36A
MPVERDGRLLATGLVLFHLALLLLARVDNANGSRQRLLGATTRRGDPAADSNCPQTGPRAGDYLDIDGVTYYVDVASQLNYFNATAECEKLDMTLLRFETLDKSDRIMSTLNANPNYNETYIWTSGRAGEDAFRGQWYWGYNKTFGPLITQFDWAPEAPFWPENNYVSCISFLPNVLAWEDHLCEYVYMGLMCQPLEL